VRRASIALVLVVGLFGCGGPGDQALPTFNDAVKGEQVDPESFLGALRGSFRTGSTAMVSFDVKGGAALRGTGAVRYARDQMDADLRLDDWKVNGASIDIRVVDGRTYMRVPESRGLWVNLSEGGAGLPGADLAGEADPRKTIGELRATLSEVRFSGTETLHGVRTRRFQVVNEPKASSGHPVVTEYWFDHHGRVVRRESELGNEGRATFVWTKWGNTARIVRPKTSEVITLKRLEQLRQKRAAPAPR
jgi:hypothetical protein